MSEETILFSSTPATHNQTCSNTANTIAAGDKTNSIVSSSSNFSSFNLHITACSSPYTIQQGVNNRHQTFNNSNIHHQNGRKLIGRNLFHTEHLKANKLSNLGVLLDKRLIAFLVLFVSIIVFYKMVIVTSKYFAYCVYIRKCM